MSNSNSVDKKKINKTIYFKKKMEDCFKIINNKSTKTNKLKAKSDNTGKNISFISKTIFNISSLLYINKINCLFNLMLY